MITDQNKVKIVIRMLYKEVFMPVLLIRIQYILIRIQYFKWIGIQGFDVQKLKGKKYNVNFFKSLFDQKLQFTYP